MGLNQHNVGSLLTDGKQKVYIASDQEDRTRASNVAQNPVEDGSAITDHISLNSDTGQISGNLLGDGGVNKDAQDYLAILEKWQNQGTQLKYYGRYFLNPIVISNVSQTFDQTLNAVKITLNWTVLHIVPAPSQAAVAVKKPVASANNGTYVTVVAGNTYWGWMMKYGTSIAQLESWNKWPATLIPIGAKARVK
jgi:LysM repeat protein